MSEARRIVLIALAVALSSACSAVIDPDESLLEGDLDSGTADSGTGGGDGSIPDTDAGTDDAGTDAGPLCPSGCDDGVACTVDSCVGADDCDHAPNDGACPDGQRCNPGSGCVPIACTGDADCDDGLVCNGTEVCDPSAPGADATTGCVAGMAPVCDDGAACTVDACDEAAGGCVSTPDHAACDDGVDCSADRCAPASSDDASGCVNEEDDAVCDTGFCFTGAVCSIASGGCVGGAERDCRDGDPCTMDSCDEAASMCVHAPRDDDGDGYPAMVAGGDSCTGGTDCDDFDDTVNPGATEVCNGVDDDCDGVVDEDCPDDCARAEEIVLDSSGSGSVSGNLGDFTADYRTACGLNGARDAVYYIDIDSLSDVRIDTIGSGADTVLAVGLACSNDGFRMGCDNDLDVGVTEQSRVWVHRIRPEIGTPTVRLYILVDGYDSSTTGTYIINVQVDTARADTCATPIDISGGGSLVGRIGFATGIGGQRGSCQGAADTSPEAIARFDVPFDRNYRFDAFSNDFDPDLYVRTAPCASGTEEACVAGDGSTGGFTTYRTTLEGTATSASTHYVFVDGAGAGDAYFLSYEP